MKEKSGEILPTPVTEPVTQRQGWNVKRTIAGGILALVLYLRFYSVDTLDYRTARTLAGYRSFLVPAGCRSKKSPISQQEIEQVLIDTPTSESARNASHSLSTSAHIAGTEGDRLSALLVKEQWEQLLHLPVTSPSHNLFESGTTASRRALTGRGGCARKGRSWLDRIKWKLGWTHSKRHSQSPRVYIDTYHPLLNYPLSHSLTLTPPGADKPSFVAKLIEDDVPEDKQSKQGRIDIPIFHGLSKNGTASAQLVYAGNGRKQDFIDLAGQGVDFKGKIAIVQYSGSFRGMKVQAATEAGCVACIIFTDPIDDGEITEANGHLPYPHGPARQPSSVQRGSVQFLSSYPGDPLTPYTPAYANATRLSRDDPTLNMPSIPSLPISYEDAIPLLASLDGKGIQLAKGGLAGVGYWTGPGDDIVGLVNLMDDKITPIWNTMAVIPGHINSEVVVMGSHRDAWNFGAADPVSGATTVHEVVKGLGALLKTGWKPLRTIVVVSWDAEEYGLIGSTEFGEDFSKYLQKNVVAYLNVDVAVAGSAYSVNASPSLADLYKDVSALITDPNNSSQSLSHKITTDQVADEDSEISTRAADSGLYVGPLGSGSDFTVFLQHLGIASANLGFNRKRTDPVYHYHSIYDSAYWMDNFGDPTFSRHVAIAQVLGLATIRLANSPILPINVTAYAHELAYYSSKVAKIQIAGDKVDLSHLDKSIQRVIAASSKLYRETRKVSHELEKLQKHHLGGKKVEKLLRRAQRINSKLSSFERGFIDVGGLPGREWYRNLVVAPGRYLGYGATTFPALTESLTLDNNTAQARIEVVRLIKSFDKIAKDLVHGL